MQKYIFIGILILAVAILFGCFGQSINEYPYYTKSASFILNGNIGAVDYRLIETPANTDILGTWLARNDQVNTSSKIQFTEKGKFQEKVYNNLTSELLANYQGSYTATNNNLIVTLNSGDSYRFTYKLSGSYLQISQ
jgi:hypothetical protein